MAQNPVTGAPVRLVVTDEDGTFLDLGGEDFSRERFSAVFARMRRRKNFRSGLHMRLCLFRGYV